MHPSTISYKHNKTKHYSCDYIFSLSLSEKCTEGDQSNFRRAKNGWRSMWIASCIHRKGLRAVWMAMRIAIGLPEQPSPPVVPSSVFFLFLPQKSNTHLSLFSFDSYLKTVARRGDFEKHRRLGDESFAKPLK